MQTITEWTAKRSGASITITGKDKSGAEVKISNVSEIYRERTDAGTPFTAATVIGAMSVILA